MHTGHPLPLRIAAAWLVLQFLAPTAHALDDRQARLVTEAREQETAMRLRGELYPDPALEAYLQGIIDRLYPGPEATYRAHVNLSLGSNARALPSGGMYVMLGALLRMRNEAELAAVLAHEGAHVAAGHAFLEVTHEETANMIATLVGAHFDVPPDTFGIRVRSILGYSRQQESMADGIGVEHMVVAGYDPAALADYLARVAAEEESRGIKPEPVMHSDHPAMLERIKAIRTQVAGLPQGRTAAAEFLAATRTARRLALTYLVRAKDGPLLLALLAEPANVAEYGELGHFALGEGHRLRAQAGDEDIALAEYGIAIEANPSYAPPFGSRGRLLARRGQRAAALADLERYVQLAPDSPDAAFARQSITRLRQETGP